MTFFYLNPNEIEESWESSRIAGINDQLGSSQNWINQSELLGRLIVVERLNVDLSQSNDQFDNNR